MGTEQIAFAAKKTVRLIKEYEHIIGNITAKWCDQLRLGTGKQIRVYDKRLEVEHQPEKMLILIQTRWGGRYPACATRVEFQVGSEGLRDLGIITLDDYEKKRSSLFHYLTHDWFRMTDTAPKDNHHSRIETAAVWTTVQETFAAWTGQAPSSLVQKVDTLPDYTQLAKQALGCVGSIVALKDITFDDEDTLRHHLKSEMWKMLNKEDMSRFKSRSSTNESGSTHWGGFSLMSELAISF